MIKSSHDIVGQVIVSPGVVVWPNGLSLDLVMERLYWVDAKLHVIACSNLDGSNIRYGGDSGIWTFLLNLYQ